MRVRYIPPLLMDRGYLIWFICEWVDFLPCVATKHWRTSLPYILLQVMNEPRRQIHCQPSTIGCDWLNVDDDACGDRSRVAIGLWVFPFRCIILAAKRFAVISGNSLKTCGSAKRWFFLSWAINYETVKRIEKYYSIPKETNAQNTIYWVLGELVLASFPFNFMFLLRHRFPLRC